MPKRVLTKKEEEVIRLMHHDFGGVDADEAANIMGITVKIIKRHLCSAKRKAPQMFPILTSRQKAILYLYHHHMSRKAIMVALNLSLDELCYEVILLRQHGFLRSRGAILPFDPSMENSIREKF